MRERDHHQLHRKKTCFDTGFKNKTHKKHTLRDKEITSVPPVSIRFASVLQCEHVTDTNGCFLSLKKMETADQ